MSLLAGHRPYQSFLWTLTLSDQGPTLVTSLNLDYLLKESISKCSHFGGWDLDK